MSNNKGITMIALILTIVVLLILSGIRIIVEVNDKGLISKSEQVRTETEKQEIEEKYERLKVFDNSNLPDVEKTVKKLQENFENITIIEPEEGKTTYGIVIVGKYDTYQYSLDENGLIDLTLLPEGEAFAILTTDGTLYFTKSDDYEIKDDGEGNQKLYSKLKGEEITKYKFKNIEKAFNVDENKKYSYTIKPEWLECSKKVKSVKVDKIIRPISTCYWFDNMNNCTIINLTNLDTKNVTDMNSMFGSCKNLKKIKGISDLDTKNVTNMRNMFFCCEMLKKMDLSNWNIINVKNMENIFFGCKTLEELDLSNWNTSQVIDMSSMFWECNVLEKINGLDKFNTDKLQEIDFMFKGCKKIKDFKDIENWDTSGVVKMQGLFDYCQLIVNLDLSNWDTLNVTNMSYMFRSCKSLLDIKWSEKFKTDNVTTMNQMFNGCNSLTKIDLSNFKTDNVTIMDKMFNECNSLTKINLSNFKTESVTDMSYMFNGCESLLNIEWSEDFKTENVTNMSYMFNGCKPLGKLDLSNWNTSKVIDMSYMFSECESLSELKISEKFITSNVKGMSYMFHNCGVLEVSEEVKKIIEKFNTAKVGEFLYSLNTVNGKVDVYGDMDLMFGGCKKLNLDCSGWDVKKLKSNIGFNVGAPGVILPLAWQITES